MIFDIIPNLKYHDYQDSFQSWNEGICEETLIKEESIFIKKQIICFFINYLCYFFSFF